MSKLLGKCVEMLKHFKVMLQQNISWSLSPARAALAPVGLSAGLASFVSTMCNKKTVACFTWSTLQINAWEYDAACKMYAAILWYWNWKLSCVKESQFTIFNESLHNIFRSICPILRICLQSCSTWLLSSVTMERYCVWILWTVRRLSSPLCQSVAKT